MDQINKELKALYDIGKVSIDKLKSIVNPKDINEGFFVCKSCGKRIPLSQMKTIKSKVKDNILDPICDECRNVFNKAKVITIVCLGCNEVIARMEPKKYKTGFETKSGNIYHILDCPKCNPDKYSKMKVQSAPLIEEQIYNQKFTKKC